MGQEHMGRSSRSVGRVQKLLTDRKIWLELSGGDAILRGKIPDGAAVRVDEGDGALVLRSEAAPHQEAA